MIEFEESTGNVYADIGQKDAAEMLIKAQLAAKIGEIIKTRKWTQQEASDVLGLSQPKLSKMLRGQFRGISEAKMLDCLARLGRDVQIVVGPARRSVAVGRVAVVFAARASQHRRSPQGLYPVSVDAGRTQGAPRPHPATNQPAPAAGPLRLVRRQIQPPPCPAPRLAAAVGD